MDRSVYVVPHPLTSYPPPRLCVGHGCRLCRPHQHFLLLAGGLSSAIMARLSIIALLVLVTFVVSDAFVSPRARWVSANMNTNRQTRCAVSCFMRGRPGGISNGYYMSRKLEQQHQRRPDCTVNVALTASGS